MSRVISAAVPVRLGSVDSPLQFVEGEHSSDAWRGGRYLALDGRHAFELSLWCGTCPLTFERMEGANRTLSVAQLQAKLNDGLEDVDADVLETVSGLLPAGDYLPMLLEVAPRLVSPLRDGDYFAEEQVRTWGIDGFWGLPEYPRTPYYRGGDYPITTTERLFEFVVPMVPPSWNDQQRVTTHAELLTRTSMPTCLAMSVLDICQPATDTGAPEYNLAHWGLIHFLLDGHHKMQAATQTGRGVRLLSVLSIDSSLARREDTLAIPRILDTSS